MSTGAPSKWPKDGRISLRISTELKHLAELHCLSPQKIFDMAMDALFWIRDERGNLIPKDKHPLLSQEAEEKHLLRPPLLPIPRLDELLTAKTAHTQASALRYGQIKRAERMRDRKLENVFDASMAGERIQRVPETLAETVERYRQMPPIEAPMTEAEYMRQLEEEGPRLEEMARMALAARTPTPPTPTVAPPPVPDFPNRPPDQKNNPFWAPDPEDSQDASE